MFFIKASVSIEGCEQAKVTYNQTSRCFSFTGFQSPPILGTDNYRYPMHQTTEQKICSQESETPAAWHGERSSFRFGRKQNN